MKLDRIILAGFIWLLTTGRLLGQFSFYTNSGVIVITGYWGSEGNVVIPSSTNGYPVVSINVNAFHNNLALTNVTIPDTIINIGDYAFSYCHNLSNITVSAGNPNYASVGGVLFNKPPTTLITCPAGFVGGYSIPNSVKNIYQYAFNQCAGLTTVAIPDSVTTIGTWAFGFCSRLQRVTIPRNVTMIGSYTFIYCTDLHQVFFQGNAPRVGTWDGSDGSADTTVFYADSGVVYYVPGTAGWGSTFGGLPTAGWYQTQPQILGSGCGLAGNEFEFTISWATNTDVVVEASTDLRSWTSILTNTLVNGTNLFSDPQWTNYPSRFYRIRSP